MRILVIGASSGIGLETVKTALAEGHQVRAFSRSSGSLNISDANLEKLPGDALNADDINAALDGIDTVIQVLGVRTSDLFGPVRLFSEATRILIPAMERLGVKRLIAVTGFGAGDSHNAISCLQQVPFRLFLGRAYDDKNIQEQLIKESNLDWTIVRPGILTSVVGRRDYKVLKEPSEWRNGIISRASVADFLVRKAMDPQYVRSDPVLVGC